MIRCRGDIPFARNDQRLGDQRTNVVRGLAGARNVHALEDRRIPDDVRSFTVRDLPDKFALVQIDGCNCSVRWLDQRQSIDIHATETATGRFLRRLGRVRSGVFAGTVENLHLSARGTGDVSDVGDFFGSGDQSNRLDARIAGVDINVVRFGIVGSARPVGAAGSSSHRERPERPFQFAYGRRGENGAEMILGGNLFRALAKSRGEIDQVVDRHAISAVGQRFRRNRLST